MNAAYHRLPRRIPSPSRAPMVPDARGLRGGRRRMAAESLLEVLIAATILAGTLTGIYVMTGRALAGVKATRENVGASRVLEDRAEQIRATTWTNVTTPSYISGTLLANLTTSGSTLLTSEAAPGGNLQETIDINPFPLPSGYPPRVASTIEVVRTASSGTVAITGSGNSATTSGSAVVIDITATWTPGLGGAPRKVTKSMIVSKYGILGTN